MYKAKGLNKCLSSQLNNLLPFKEAVHPHQQLAEFSVIHLVQHLAIQMAQLLAHQMALLLEQLQVVQLLEPRQVQHLELFQAKILELQLSDKTHQQPPQFRNNNLEVVMFSQAIRVWQTQRTIALNKNLKEVMG